MKAAVIGVGNMGKHHARVYSQIKDCRLVAIVDSNEAIGNEIAKKYNCNFYRTHEELLKKEKPDAISVCVPTSMHYKIASDIIKSDISVLIEKPIASTLEQAAELVRLAKKNNVKLMVGHLERFNPAVQKLKQIVKAGELGEITSLLARRVGLFPPQIKDMDVVIDLAVHDIDIFNYLLEMQPTEVFSNSGKAIGTREDYAGILLKYNGINGLIEVNWITPVKIRLLNITGTKGYAELNYVTQDLIVHESNYEKGHDQFGDFVVKFGEPKKREISIEKEEPLKLEIRHFLESIKNNTEPLTNGEEAIKTLGIALKVIKNRT